jgi:2,5-diketo-D-gluconate reductase B
MTHQSIQTIGTGRIQIPAIGLGTGGLPEDCGELVAHALACGYRHIDTARKYGTEVGVGEGIRASGLARDQIFVTTKVSHEHLHAAEFARSVDTSLHALGLAHVDLLMVHWPTPDMPIAEAMIALASAKRSGLTRHIGVANFNIGLLDDAIHRCPEPLDALQAEYHPHLDQTKILSACRTRELAFIAYCPLGRGRPLTEPAIGEIARRHGRTAAQVALRWLMQQGVAAIPRSTNTARIAENAALFDFSLTAADMSRIDALKRSNGRLVNPAGRAPIWD